MPPTPPLPHDQVVERLRAAGCVFAEEEADLLLQEAKDASHLEDLLARRVSGLPLEHVLGWAAFAGHRVAVEPGVFVPRRRSELLVAESVALVRAGDHVVDLCCGSGAIGAAVAAGRPGIALHAVDLDERSVRCAAQNLAPHGGRVYLGDLYAALPRGLTGRVDLIVANAPYVPSDDIALMPPEARLHEARSALDGGADGLEVQRQVASGAGSWLRPGGHVVVETSLEQSSRTLELFAARGFAARITRSDELAATAVVGRLMTG